jgi:hypothetical protein
VKEEMMLQRPPANKSRDRISALVPGFGYVCLAACLSCRCGRLIEPQDVIVHDDTIGIVCGGCHITLLKAEWLPPSEEEPL